jgi:hypothetical protein
LRKVVISLPVVLTEALSTIMPEKSIEVGVTWVLASRRVRLPFPKDRLEAEAKAMISSRW